MPDSMSVRLHRYRIRVEEVVVDLPELLEVVIRDLRSVVRCPVCGLKDVDGPRNPAREGQGLAHRWTGNSVDLA